MCEVCKTLKGKKVIDNGLYYSLLQGNTHYYITKSTDDPTFEVDEEMGEGEATEEEIDYRKELMTALAAIFPAMLLTVKSKDLINDKLKEIDKLLAEWRKESKDIILTNTNLAFDNAVTDANTILEGFKDGIKTVPGDAANLAAIQKQQIDNITDISNYLRGRILQGLNMNEVNTIYDTTANYEFINTAFNEAQLRLDQLGVFGWVESHKQGTTTALVAGMAVIGAVLVADWVPDYSNPNPDWPCDECIALEEGGPYPLFDWPMSPHFGCRCEQQNVRIMGT